MTSGRHQFTEQADVQALTGRQLVSLSWKVRSNLVMASHHRAEAERYREWSDRAFTDSDRSYWKRQAAREIGNAEYYEGKVL